VWRVPSSRVTPATRQLPRQARFVGVSEHWAGKKVLVLERRYGKVASGEAVAPDLILIDGGKGQHRIAREVLTELGLDYLLSIGIAKGVKCQRDGGQR